MPRRSLKPKSVYWRALAGDGRDQGEPTEHDGKNHAQDHERRAQSVPDRTQEHDPPADAEAEPDAPQPWSRHREETPGSAVTSQKKSKKMPHGHRIAFAGERGAGRNLRF